MFNTREADWLRRQSGAQDYVFDQCMFDLEYKKPTQILSNADLSKLQLTCCHGHGAHYGLRGRDNSGQWETKSQAWYPSALCKALARAYMHVFIKQAMARGNSTPSE